MKTLLVVLLCTAVMAQVYEEPAHVQRLKDYLYRYGYLPDSDLEKGVLRTERELEQATLRFQKFMGLEMTGKLDGPTWDMLGKPRCGMPDMMVTDDGQGIVEVASPANYSLYGTKWDTMPISYGNDNHTRDLTLIQVYEAIDQAAQKWISASDVLRLRRDAGATSDIKITFTSLARHLGCPDVFGPNDLGHAIFPNRGHPMGGDIHFNDVETFTSGSGAEYDLFAVALHEFGHSFGIEHSDTYDAVMWPTYHYVVDLHQDDYDAIRAIYD